MSKFHNTKWLLSRGLLLASAIPFLLFFAIIFLSIAPFMCVLEVFIKKKKPEISQYPLFYAEKTEKQPEQRLH